MQLANGEHIVGKIKKHWAAIILPFIVLFLSMLLPMIFIWLLPIGILWAVYLIIIYYVEEITLTNRQFYVRTGIINKKVTAIPLRKINAINYEQGFLGRILGYGTLLVQAGSDLTFSGYSYIANPEKTKTIIEQAIEAAETK